MIECCCSNILVVELIDLSRCWLIASYNGSTEYDNLALQPCCRDYTAQALRGNKYLFGQTSSTSLQVKSKLNYCKLAALQIIVLVC